MIVDTNDDLVLEVSRATTDADKLAVIRRRSREVTTEFVAMTLVTDITATENKLIAVVLLRHAIHMEEFIAQVLTVVTDPDERKKVADILAESLQSAEVVAVMRAMHSDDAKEQVFYALRHRLTSERDIHNALMTIPEGPRRRRAAMRCHGFAMPEPVADMVDTAAAVPQSSSPTFVAAATAVTTGIVESREVQRRVYEAKTGEQKKQILRADAHRVTDEDVAMEAFHNATTDAVAVPTQRVPTALPVPSKADNVAGPTTSFEELCVACLCNVRNAIVVDCGHECLCTACSKMILATSRVCPICRRPVLVGIINRYKV